jgi:PEP-CTERM motif
MFRKAIRRALPAIAACILATSAHAETIDFESQHGGYGYYPYSFVEDGFRVTYSPISPFGFYIIDDPAEHLGMCGSGCASNGTVAFYLFNESSVTIDLPHAGSFSLTSLDVAKTFLGNDLPLTLTLTATGANGVVSSTIFVDAGPAEVFSTFTFADFTNISSLTITGGQQFPEFAIDNVILSAVPEPASWATLLGGLGMLGCAFRRRLSRRPT